MNHPFRVPAYVVLVDMADGPVAALATALKALGLCVVLVPETAAALEFVEACPRLALAVVNLERDWAGQPDFSSAVRTVVPPLGVLCFDESTANLLAAAESRLREHFYADDLVGELSAAAIAALGGFGSQVHATGARLASASLEAVEACRSISLSGETVQGWLRLGGSLDYLGQLHQSMFPGSSPATPAEVADLLGEICNRTLGRVKNHFVQRGIASELGVPQTCSAEPLSGTELGVPALGFDLENAIGKLSLRFRLEEAETNVSGTDRAEELLASGRITVL